MSVDRRYMHQDAMSLRIGSQVSLDRKIHDLGCHCIIVHTMSLHFPAETVKLRRSDRACCTLDAKTCLLDIASMLLAAAESSQLMKRSWMLARRKRVAENHLLQAEVQILRVQVLDGPDAISSFCQRHCETIHSSCLSSFTMKCSTDEAVF